MRNTLQIFCLLACVALLAVACSKPEISLPPAPRKAQLVRMQTGGVFTDFRYDADGRLLERSDSARGYSGLKSTFEYSQGKLVKGSYGFMRYQYEYPNNNTVKVKTGSLSNPELQEEVFTYSGDRLLEYVRYYVSPFGTEPEPEMKEVYTYNAAGNIVRKEEFGFDTYESKQWKKISTTNYVYDDKPNYSAGLEDWLYPYHEKRRTATSNNPVKVDVYGANNQLVRTELFRYDYDNDGKKTVKYGEKWSGNRLLSRDTTKYLYQ